MLYYFGTMRVGGKDKLETEAGTRGIDGYIYKSRESVPAPGEELTAVY